MKIENSLLVEPDLHDAEVIGLSVSGLCSNKVVVINLKQPTGMSAQLRFEGVEGFSCNDFWLQNVILDVAVHRGANCESEIQESVNGIEIFRESWKRLAKRVESGDLYFITATPSVGCVLRRR